MRNEHSACWALVSSEDVWGLFVSLTLSSVIAPLAEGISSSPREYLSSAWCRQEQLPRACGMSLCAFLSDTDSALLSLSLQSHAAAAVTLAEHEQTCALPGPEWEACSSSSAKFSWK